MKATTDPRHHARMIALQRLFERDFRCGDITKKHKDELSLEALEKIDIIDFYDEKLLKNILEGIKKTHEQIDKTIEELAPEWPITQIAKVDLQILRIAIYEGFIAKSVPMKVAIDEAIELAKEFGGGTSSRFVNGVLGTLVKRKIRVDPRQATVKRNPKS